MSGPAVPVGPRTRSLRLTRRLDQVVERRGESGAALLLALIFLTVILILVLALFGSAFTGAASIKSYRRERVLRYSADAALQASIQMVKVDATLGVYSTTPAACGLTYAIVEDDGGGQNPAAITPGSTLSVSCAFTPGQTTSGVLVAGEQQARDVTFTVTCAATTPATAHDRIGCGSGSTSVVLARARVRYEADRSLTAATWAVVPKILSYRVTRG